MEAFNGAANQQPYPDFVGSALQGVDAGQHIRGVQALQGINLNDAGSLNAGIANLVRAGAADQASALMGLQLKRSAIEMTPKIMEALSGGGQQQQPQGPDPAAAAQLHAQVAQDARAFSQTPQDQQPAMAAALKAKYLKLGVPEAAIDSALTHAATPGGADDLAGVHDNHATLLNGGQVAPDASMAHGGSYNWTQSLLGNPGLQTGIHFIKQYGGPDLTGLINTAHEIQAPAIAKAAEIAGAPALAKIDVQRQVDAQREMIPGKLAESVLTAAGTKGATAPYEVVEAKNDDGSVTQGTIHVENGKTIFTPLNGGPGAGGGFGHTPGIASATNLAGQAGALTSESTEAGKRLTGYPHAIANAQTLLGLANSVGTGAYTAALGKAANALPLTHSAKDYAANAGMLAQDLAGTFKDALNGLPVPRVSSEAKSITGAIPKDTSPQDQVKVYAAGLLAATQYQKAHDQFIQDWTADQKNPRDLSQAQKAWNDGAGKASLFSMPAWQGVTVGGKPAVVTHSYGGHEYVIPLYGLLGKNAKPIMVR